MTDLDSLLAIAGVAAVTVLVLTGMILIAPRGTVAVDDVTDPQGAEPSGAHASDPAPTAARRPAAHVEK